MVKESTIGQNNNSPERGKENPVVMKVLGILMLALAVFSVLLYWSNTQARANGGRDLSPILFYFYVGVPIGVGLLLRRKWAAILLAIACVIVSGSLAIGTVLYVPFPFWIINLALAVGLAMPAVGIWKCWSGVVWRGRWFL